MKCDVCQHRQWQEGDYEYSPPGYGIYFCDLVPAPGGMLHEDVAKGRKEPDACPLKGAQS